MSTEREAIIAELEALKLSKPIDEFDAGYNAGLGDAIHNIRMLAPLPTDNYRDQVRVSGGCKP